MSKKMSAVLLRLDPELKRQAEALAAVDDRSLNKWIVQALKKAVKEQSNV
ncbi:MAG: HicB family [Cyanobacteriota bacterium]|jgi:predicted HicB family RNase H-like nuclease